METTDQQSETEPLTSFNPHKDVSQFQKTLSYLCFFILGACILLPWNSLLVSTSYFGSNLVGSEFEFSYMNWVAVIFTFFNVSFLIHATLKQTNSSHTRRIFFSLIVIIIISLALLFSTRFENVGPNTFFAFLMIITLLEAFGSATLQNSVIAISSWFGPDYLQGILSGQGANGAIVSLLQLLASLREFESTPQDDFGPTESNHSEDGSSPIIHISQDKIRNSSFTFYIGSTIFCVFALLSFVMLCSLPFYKLVMKTNKKKVTSSSERLSIEGERSTDQLLPSTEYSTQDPFPSPPIKPVNLRTVEPKIRSLGLSVFWVFFVTLAVFPSITGAIISIHSPNITPSKTSTFFQNWHHPLIFIPLHFLCFNCGDWLGRIIPQIWSSFSFGLIKKKKVLWIMSFSRIIFVPLFLLCNVEKSSVVLFKSDLAYFIILSLFAISNGYTSCLLMIAGVAEPSLEPEEIAVAATCMSLYLTSGLAMGSFISFGVKALTTVL